MILTAFIRDQCYSHYVILTSEFSLEAGNGNSGTSQSNGNSSLPLAITNLNVMKVNEEKMKKKENTVYLNVLELPLSRIFNSNGIPRLANFSCNLNESYTITFESTQMESTSCATTLLTYLNNEAGQLI